LLKKPIFAILLTTVDKMSVIQTIRNKYLGVMIAFIVIALIGFLVMDGLQSNAGNLTGGGNERGVITKINGKNVDVTELQAAEELAVNNLKAKNPKAKDAEIKAAKDEAYTQLISDKLIKDECDKLGLKVTDKEFQEMLTGQYADPFIQQNFRDPNTGQFNPAAVKEYVTQIRNNRTKDDKAKQAYEQWLDLEKSLEKQRIVQKYTGLIGMGVYQPKAAVKQTIAAREGTASASYVMVPYESIKEDIKVSDADIQAYEKRFESAFQLDRELRRMEFVSFDITPTSNDTAASLGVINKMSADFAAAPILEEFIGKNGDELYDNAFHASGEFATPAIDSVASKAVGSIVGPYFDEGFFRLSKVVDKRVLPDSVQASVIFIRPSETMNDEAAEKRADSLKGIANSANFATLASTFSADEQTKAKGGDIGFINVKEVGSNELLMFLQTGTKGQIGKVKQGGMYQIVLITDVRAMKSKAKIATFSKRLLASKTTTDAVYAKASSFMKGVTDRASFDKAIKTAGVNKKVAEAVASSQTSIDGLPDATEVVRYAYANAAGKVSGIMNAGGDKYVVAVVTDVYAKGLAPVGLVRNQLQGEVIRDKKAAKIAGLYKGMTLDQIAAKAAVTVSNADTIVLDGQNNNDLGQEARVVGACFNKANVGKVSSAIYGNRGVYFVNVRNVGKRVVPSDEPAIEQERAMYQQQVMRNFGNSLPDILRRRANVEDKRGL
jgi:peptidyl-prolyl cis-trans isomerase D